MNAIDFLLKEHTKVRKIFAEINESSHKFETKRKLFAELCDDLIRHEIMEEKIWYPYFKTEKKVGDTVKHLISEEKHAEKAIKEFDNIKTDEEWQNKFVKFRQNVEHHAHEEETKLFPVIKKMFTEEALEKIGQQMYEFKQKYIQQNIA